LDPFSRIRQILRSLCMILCATLPLTHQASADQVLREFPGGSGEEMLKNPKNPEFMTRDAAETKRLQTNFGVKCSSPDGRSLGADDPAYTNCLAEKANAQGIEKTKPSTAPGK
jgi:hypothetical protein